VFGSVAFNDIPNDTLGKASDNITHVVDDEVPGDPFDSFGNVSDIAGKISGKTGKIECKG